MKLSPQNSSLLLSAVTGAGIVCGTLTAFFVLSSSKAYACTGVLGSVDPTCPGRIFNQGDGDDGGACVQGFPSPTMREFTITNLNPFPYDFIVDGQVYRLERGQTLNFSKRVQQAVAACTGGSTTGIPAPVVEFDGQNGNRTRMVRLSIAESGYYEFQLDSDGVGINLWQISSRSDSFSR